MYNAGPDKFYLLAPPTSSDHPHRFYAAITGRWRQELDQNSKKAKIGPESLRVEEDQRDIEGGKLKDCVCVENHFNPEQILKTTGWSASCEISLKSRLFASGLH